MSIVRRVDLIQRVSVLVHRLIDTRYSVATTDDIHELEVLEELVAKDIDDYMARRYAKRWVDSGPEPDANGLIGKWNTRRKLVTRSQQ